MIVAMLAATVLMADSTTALQATTAPATPASQAAAGTQPAKKKAENQADLICKSEPVLGSRMPVKKCRTADQAAAEKQNAREELERAQGTTYQPH